MRTLKYRKIYGIALVLLFRTRRISSQRPNASVAAEAATHMGAMPILI
jgi:hypothetical protein